MNLVLIIFQADRDELLDATQRREELRTWDIGRLCALK